MQEAFARAAATRDRSVLLNPAAWITTVAKRIVIDAARRDAALRERLPLVVESAASNAGEFRGLGAFDAPGGDDRLGLLFVACTPELTPDTRLALALRFVCGVPTATVANALLVEHTAMSARITRAKRMIDRRGIRFSPESADDFRARIDDVLATVHVLYTVGHTAFEGDELTARDVTMAAVELARALHSVAPGNTEVAGLLALLLLTEARAATRTDDLGRVSSIEKADRHKWNRALVVEGLELATIALNGGGRFGLEAGISGLHSSTLTWASTDWPAICSLYDRLVERWPSPAAQLARVVARSYLPDGLEQALAELDVLDAKGAPVATRAPSATPQSIAARADVLRRMGRGMEAAAQYRRAAAAERNAAVREFYERRGAEVSLQNAGDTSAGGSMHRRVP